MLKPEPERQGFQHLLRGQTDANVSEIMFERYYGLNILSLENFGENTSKSCLFQYL